MLGTQPGESGRWGLPIAVLLLVLKPVSVSVVYVVDAVAVVADDAAVVATMVVVTDVIVIVTLETNTTAAATATELFASSVGL